MPAPSLIRINNTNNLIYRKRSQKGIKITKDQALRDAKDSVPDPCHPLHLAALDPGKKKRKKNPRKPRKIKKNYYIRLQFSAIIDDIESESVNNSEKERWI